MLDRICDLAGILGFYIAGLEINLANNVSFFFVFVLNNILLKGIVRVKILSYSFHVVLFE